MFERSRPHAAARAREGKNRRKGEGHPATAEVEYTRDDLEFQNAIQEWKNRTGRQFPTWKEVLGVMKSLGYAKPDSS